MKKWLALTLLSLFIVFVTPSNEYYYSIETNISTHSKPDTGH